MEGSLFYPSEFSKKSSLGTVKLNLTKYRDSLFGLKGNGEKIAVLAVVNFQEERGETCYFSAVASRVPMGFSPFLAYCYFDLKENL